MRLAVTTTHTQKKSASYCSRLPPKDCSHEYCPTVEAANVTNKHWTMEHLVSITGNCRKAGITSGSLIDIHRNKKLET